MSLQYHLYTLRSRGSLNAVSSRTEFHGALIRLNEGVGCLHPWPEFGDQPVEEQLKLLREGGSSKVIERALHMVEVDGAARRAGVSLFQDLQIPRSHYSWDHHQPEEFQCARVLSEGWRAVKTKGHKNHGQTTQWLKRFLNETREACVRVRVDFNSCLTLEEFSAFLESLSIEERDYLDFMEDPFPYDAEAWGGIRERYAVPLALDKQLSTAAGGFDFAVMKPGRRDWRLLIELLPVSVRTVFTSAMDHAVGQSFAAWEAASAQQALGLRMDLCGLCTEHLFEQDAFFARLSSTGGTLTVDVAGTGLGFDDVLADIPWKTLD